MGRTYNIHEAKTHFSKILEAVERGEEITIARRGKPIAKVVAETAPAKPRRRELGTLTGKVVIDDSFYDDMTEEEMAPWYNSSPELDDYPARPERTERPKSA